MEKRIYEIINPSDTITVRATPEEASIFALILNASMYFLRDAETGEDAAKLEPEEWRRIRDAIFTDPVRRKSYADVFRSALVGSVRDRRLFEDAVSRMSPEDAKQFAAKWHDEHRTSLNDICARLWERVPIIENWQPETGETA